MEDQSSDRGVDGLVHDPSSASASRPFDRQSTIRSTTRNQNPYTHETSAIHHDEECHDPLLLLNTRPQSERTRNNDIATIKFRKELHTLSRHLQPQSKAIVDIPLETLPMILLVIIRIRNQFIDSSFR